METKTREKIRLLEILQGYSVIGDDSERFFFKHPTVLDKLNEAFRSKELEKRGRKIGLLNEEELISEAISNGNYSTDLEDEKADLEWALDKKKKLAAKFQDNALLKANEESIKRDLDRISEINNIRSSFVQSSLENFVTSKGYLHSCRNFCFKDPDLKEKIEEDDVNKYIALYLNTYNDIIDLDNILRTSYLPDFFELVRLSDDPLFIFGEKATNITLFQRDLLICSKLLKFKIDNVNNIPKKILNDAVLLYHFVPSTNHDAKETNIRELVEEKGGIKNMSAGDKLT